jgi:hypothetical protein
VRTPQPQFVVHKSPTPNGKKSWYIIGRPHGERVRSWFFTESEAQKEADRRNQEMVKGSSPAAKNDGKLADAAVLPSSTITETEVFRAIIRDSPPDDIESMDSPWETAREISRLEEENSRLRKENAQMRDCLTAIQETLARAKAELGITEWI